MHRSPFRRPPEETRRPAETIPRLRGALRDLARDPRHYQIAVLSTLLIFGMTVVGLQITPGRAALILAATLSTQMMCTRIWKLPAFDGRSPLISGLSLSLFLRTGSPWFAALGGALAILSKFTIRREGKHVFNPTNFAIAALLLITDRVWVSSGQWGSTAIVGYAMAGLGGLVVYRAARSDVTLAFLASYAAILFGRALWLGDPWTIPMHQLQSGTLLIFTFHMISDPRTTPDSRRGRILFAALVAAGAGFIQFVLFKSNGPIWSLLFFSPLVPLIDRFLPGTRHHWPKPASRPHIAGLALNPAAPAPRLPRPMISFFDRLSPTRWRVALFRKEGCS
jgi:Na+-transporting NADH:ubiquinone oxidoreductase subunit NqrB